MHLLRSPRTFCFLCSACFYFSLSLPFYIPSLLYSTVQYVPTSVHIFPPPLPQNSFETKPILSHVLSLFLPLSRKPPRKGGRISKWDISLPWKYEFVLKRRRGLFLAWIGAWTTMQYDWQTLHHLAPICSKCRIFFYAPWFRVTIQIKYLWNRYYCTVSMWVCTYAHTMGGNKSLLYCVCSNPVQKAPF